MACLSSFAVCAAFSIGFGGPALAQQTRSSLNTEITTNYPDNVTGLITPSILRTTSSDIVTSAAILADTNTFAPAANTYTQSIVINQSGPASGSIAGEKDYNAFSVTHQSAVSASGTTPFRTDVAAGWKGTITTGGANVSGYVIGALYRINHTVGNSNSPAGDYIALASQAYSNKVEAGAPGLYGFSSVSYVDATGGVNHQAGNNSEVTLISGGAVNFRVAYRAQSTSSTAQAATSDAAFTVVSQGGGDPGFKKMFNLSEFGNAQSISSTGDVFAAQQAMTVSNVFNLSNMTVTSNIFNFPNFLVSGNGTLTLSNNAAGTTLPAGPTGTIVHFAGANGAVSRVTNEAFGTGASAAYTARSARGTGAAQTATQSGDFLGSVTAIGYGATAYGNNAGTAIISLASQNYTDANQGSQLDFYTTVNGTNAAVRVGTFGNDGGMLWPNAVAGGSQGAGSINATKLFQAGVQAATLSGAEELTNKTLTSAVAKGTWTASGTWTIPAVTLNGTVSGGGNTINNMPILIGGTAVGSSLELRATSGAGAGSEFVRVTVGSNGAVENTRFTESAGGVQQMLTGATAFTALGDTSPGSVHLIQGAAAYGYIQLTNTTASNTEMGRLTWGSPNFSGADKRTAVVRSSNVAASSVNPTGVIEFFTNNAGTLATAMTIDATGNVTAATGVQTGTTVVASLPACNAGNKGKRYFVTDSNATTFHNTVAGGGANNVGVTCDGTNWYIS